MSDRIELSRIQTETALIPIVGTAPLIMHKFSEKAKKQMLDAMQGRKEVKTPKDPEAEYLSAAYRTADGYGFPDIAFKAATVGGARFFSKSVKMTELRQSMFFEGDISEHDSLALFPIFGEPRMREDVVTVGRGGSDLRYRPEFPEWSTTLKVRFVTSMLTRDSLLSLVDAGGLGVGVGEWRPQRSGSFGTYQIDETRETVFIGGTK